MSIESLTERQHNLIIEIDACFNFIVSDPDKAQEYVDIGKDKLLEHMALELELMNLHTAEMTKIVKANESFGAFVNNVFPLRGNL